MKEDLLSILQSQNNLDLSSRLHHHACVAIILKGPDIENLELAFIQRAFNPEDRWSGQIAFPGGRREEQDRTALEAALRETLEEVGMDLLPEELLGQLHDIQARKAGAHLDFFIRPFVFYTNREFSITLDASEVADFFWVPLREIQSQQRRTTYLSLPAVQLDREPPLWGLTYMMVLDLLERLSRAKKGRPGF